MIALIGAAALLVIFGAACCAVATAAAYMEYDESPGTAGALLLYTAIFRTI